MIFIYLFKIYEVCPSLWGVAQMLRNVVPCRRREERERERVGVSEKKKTKCRSFIQWRFDMSALFGGISQKCN